MRKENGVEWAFLVRIVLLIEILGRKVVDIASFVERVSALAGFVTALIEKPSIELDVMQCEPSFF